MRKIDIRAAEPEPGIEDLANAVRDRCGTSAQICTLYLTNLFELIRVKALRAGGCLPLPEGLLFVLQKIILRKTMPCDSFVTGHVVQYMKNAGGFVFRKDRGYGEKAGFCAGDAAPD